MSKANIFAIHKKQQQKKHNNPLEPSFLPLNKLKKKCCTFFYADIFVCPLKDTNLLINKKTFFQ